MSPMLTGKNQRVPKRQIEEIDGDETRIYQALGGSGIGRKPYATDEFQALQKEFEADAKRQEQIDKDLRS